MTSRLASPLRARADLRHDSRAALADGGHRSEGRSRPDSTPLMFAVSPQRPASSCWFRPQVQAERFQIMWR